MVLHRGGPSRLWGPANLTANASNTLEFEVVNAAGHDAAITAFSRDQGLGWTDPAGHNVRYRRKPGGVQR